MKVLQKPQEVHREKLKQLGYKDEAIEELVNKYIANCTYEFAEAYQTELLNIDSVRQQRELLKAYEQANNPCDCDSCKETANDRIEKSLSL